MMLVTPVFRRYALTEIMLVHRRAAFNAAAALGVECGCVVIGDEENVAAATSLGFDGILAPNVLGSKYNDGHEFALNTGWDISLQCNSDQVFHPDLLVALSEAPLDKLIRTIWMTFVHGTGTRCLSFQNPVWALKAYPTELLKSNPRPCEESIMRMCDTSTHNGVVSANPGLDTHTIEVGPLECIQFESSFQITPWKKNLHVAMMTGERERPVPWKVIADMYGENLERDMRRFYGMT